MHTVPILSLSLLSFIVCHLASASEGGFCTKRFVNGKWINLGDCGVVPKTLAKVTKEIKTTLGCGMSNFNFRNELHFDYAQFNGTLPLLTSFSACFWLRRANSTTHAKGAVLSYCGTGAAYCNSILVFISNSITMTVYLNNKEYSFNNVPSIDYRSHACIVLSSEDGLLHYYLNGTEQADAVKARHSIPAGGVLILGQDQDGEINRTIPGPPGQNEDGFYGLLEDVRIWKRALDPMEIQDLHAFDCKCPSDAIVSFTETNTIIQGDVVQNWENTCLPNDS